MDFVFDTVAKLKEKFGSALIIISGACSAGADRFARISCDALGVEILEYPVDTSTPIQSKWEYRKRAYARNSLIAQDSEHALFALVWEGRKGGTEDTVTKYSDLIVNGDRERRLFIVDKQLKVERWRPTIDTKSSWTICQGNVSRQD